MKRLTLITAPASEPLDLTTLKAWCRIDSTDFDTLLTDLCIPAARRACEHETGRALITQTWDQAEDAFPSCGYIALAKTPVQSVTSVKYDDEAGTEQTLAATDYRLVQGRHEARIELAPGKSWPATLAQSACVRVRTVCGYGAAAAVPQGLRQWIALHAAAMLDNPAAAQDKREELAPNPLFAGLLAAETVPVL